MMSTPSAAKVRTRRALDTVLSGLPMACTWRSALIHPGGVDDVREGRAHRQVGRGETDRLAREREGVGPRRVFQAVRYQHLVLPGRHRHARARPCSSATSTVTGRLSAVLVVMGWLVAFGARVVGLAK
jgi:hypothetical protein